MKICLNSVSFGNRDISFHDKTHNILETYDDNEHLIRRTKYDKQFRDVDCQVFDKERKVIGHLHKEYTPDGCIETYKSKTQEYVRVIRTLTDDTFTRHIEIFTSKTSPESNYVNEFVRDLKGKLIKIINNGKVINL